VHIGMGTVRVSATIDIHGDTDMDCVVHASGEVELGLGDDAEAHLVLTREGAEKLVATLTRAGVGGAANTHGSV
jgi:hypothetical protein